MSMHLLRSWGLITMIVAVTIRGDPVNKHERIDGPSMTTSRDGSTNEGEEPLNEGQEPFSSEGSDESRVLALATARLVEELAKHGLSSSSPFALLLNSEAPLWGRASQENPVVRVPLSQAEAAARAAAKAVWESPVVRKARDFFVPCLQPDADLSLCVREGFLKMVDGAARLEDVQLMGGALTVKRTEDVRGRALPDGVHEVPEDELQTLPEDPEERGDRLDEIIVRRLTDLAASHVVTLRMTPETVASARSGIEEFRRRRRKGGKMMPMLLMMALMMKSVLMHLAMGAIAMIAGKALTVGLIALVISSIIGLKKLASGGGGGGGGYEVVNVSPSHHQARYLPEGLPEDVAPHLQQLQRLLDPYRAHVPPLPPSEENSAASSNKRQ